VLLNFRPEDLFHKSFSGSVQACGNKVLAKIRVTRPAGSDGSDLMQATKIELVEVCGPVKRVVRFRKMSPYQFDVRIPEAWEGLASALNRMDRDALGRYAEQMLAEAEGPPYIFPPPISTHFHQPFPILLGPDTATSTTSGLLRAARPRKAAELRTRLPWLVSFGDAAMPSEPSPEALALMGGLQAELVEEVKRLMEEGQRPVVTRGYVGVMGGIVGLQQARVLPLLAYCFVDGPWRNCWVRYGLDPRSDPAYAKYQTVQCRNNLINAEINAPDEDMTSSESYEFHGTKSSAPFAQYQFLDLHYPPLASYLRQKASHLREVCSKMDGWYPAGTVGSVRRQIRARWMEVLREGNPEAWAKMQQIHSKGKTEESFIGDDEEDEDEDQEDDMYAYYDE